MACRLRASRLSLSHWTKGRMFSEISGHGHRCGVDYCSRNSEENLKACRTFKSISTVCLTCLPGFAWVGQRTGRANCLRHA